MREMRRSERYGSGGGWVGGLVLVSLGIVLLLQNMGMLLGANTWALFILVPAVATFGAAWNVFLQSDMHLSGAVIRLFVTGIVLTGLAGMLFFDLDLTYVGPAMLILIGAGTLISAGLRPTHQ